MIIVVIYAMLAIGSSLLCFTTSSIGTSLVYFAASLGFTCAACFRLVRRSKS